MDCTRLYVAKRYEKPLHLVGQYDWTKGRANVVRSGSMDISGNTACHEIGRARHAPMVSGDGDGWIQPEQWRGTFFCCLMFIDRLVGEKMFRAMWLLNMTFCHLFVEDENSAIVGSKKWRNDRCCFCRFDPVDDPLFVCSWWKNILKYILQMTYSEKNSLQKIFTMFQNGTWRITLISMVKFSQGTFGIPRFQPSWYCNLGYKQYLLVWNIFYFSIYWEFHHHNWRTHIFQRGRYTTNQLNNMATNYRYIVMSKALHMSRERHVRRNHHSGSSHRAWPCRLAPWSFATRRPLSM